MGKGNNFGVVTLLVLMFCGYVLAEMTHINKSSVTNFAEHGEQPNEIIDRRLMAMNTSIYDNNAAFLTEDIFDVIDNVDKEVYKKHPSDGARKETHNYGQLALLEDNQQYYNKSNNLKSSNITKLLSPIRHEPLTFNLSFDFHFYGHPVIKMIVAPDGLIYTGHTLQSTLAVTQYIAPLMAHFNSIHYTRSLVRVNDNKTALTVLGEEMGLYIEPEMGKFTFSATLHLNGEIVFVYFNIAVKISEMKNTNHPVKIGISGAYMLGAIDYIIFVRHETTYEYNRINFTNLNLLNSTIIRLTPLPTCAKYEICASCVHHQLTLGCTWCPTLRGCFSEFDRYKNNSIDKACNSAQVKEPKMCYFLGDDGYSSNYFNKINSTAVVGANHTNKFNTTDNANEYETANIMEWIIIFILYIGTILIVDLIVWQHYIFQ